MQETSYWRFLLRNLPEIALDTLSDVIVTTVLAVLIVVGFRLPAITIVVYFAMLGFGLAATAAYGSWKAWRILSRGR